MRELTDPEVRSIESLIDGAYSSTFPASNWQEGVASLALANESIVSQVSIEGGTGKAAVDAAERGKYGLMHALRWGHTAPLALRPGLQALRNDAVMERAFDCVVAGMQYTQLFNVFTAYSRGRVSLHRHPDGDLEFAPKPGFPLDVRAAYNALDRFGERQTVNADVVEVAREIEQAARVAVQPLDGLMFDYNVRIQPFAGICERYIAAAQGENFTLPQTWAFRGIPVGLLRRFWAALQCVCLTHRSAVRRLLEGRCSGWEGLVLWSKARWITTISALGGLDQKTTEAILDLHRYDRALSASDVALTPFVELGGGTWMLSPVLVTSGALERNLYAHLCRTAKAEIDDASHLLAAEMTEQLRERFHRVGVRTAVGVRIGEGTSGTDVDLAAWSEKERFLLTMELKWFVAPGDVREDFERERACLHAQSVQLPKHGLALSSDLPGFMRKAFGRKATTLPTAFASLLVARGYSGSEVTHDGQFPLVAEDLLVREIRRRKGLRHLAEYVIRKDYLPKLGPVHGVFDCRSGLRFRTTTFDARRLFDQPTRLVGRRS